MISANAVYWIMLTRALGYNNPKFKMLAALYDNIAEFVEKGEKEWRLCGLFHSMDMQKLSAMNRNEAKKVLAQCEALHYSVLTLDDPAYPERLYHIYAPPAVLYINGKLPCFDDCLSVGIVGTRTASRYGTDNAYKIAFALAKYNTVIVSGGALGVDCASHRGALAAGGVTVCVRGCGINSRYLRDNQQMREAVAIKGAVISEYPPGEEARAYYFPARNRIIAALSDGVLMIEAGIHSGSLITANLALEMGKDLFALLGNNSPRNEGSNNRIKEGTAVPVTDFMDILAYYSKETDADDRVDFDSIRLADLEAVPVKTVGSRGGEWRRRKPADEERREKTPEKAGKNNSSAVPRELPAAPPKAAAPSQEVIGSLKGDAKEIYQYLTAEPVHIDTIADDLNLPVNRVLTTLTLLELQGYVTALQGRHYMLK